MSEVTYEHGFGDGWPTEKSRVVRAMRGTDGATLWIADATAADATFVIPSEDLDDDGADDLLFLSVTFEHDEAISCDLACEYEPIVRYHWDFIRIDGRTGTPAWTRTYPGELVAGGGLFGTIAVFAGALVYSGTNVAVLPLIADDHDGDGVKDVVMNTLDLAYSFGGGATIAVGATAAVLATQTRAAVIDGAGGKDRLTRESGWNAGIAILAPVAQAAGDARGDLRWTAERSLATGGPCVVVATPLVCEPLVPSSFTIEMIDGATLTTAWETHRTEPDAIYSDAALFDDDFTGDGLSDLIVDERLRAGGTRMVIVSGADGSEAWRAPALGPVDVLGDVGGSPGADLLHGWYSDDQKSVTLARIDGGTGAELARSRYEALETQEEDASFSVEWSVMSDADGDAAADLVLDVADWSDEEYRWRAVVESGSSGAVLLERPQTFLSPAGDLDGDGLADVFEFDYEYDGGWSFETAAWSPRAGERRWQRFDRMSDDAWVWPRTTGDTDGDGADDLLYDRIQVPHESAVESRVDVLDGRTGLVRWGIGPDLTPPPGPTGIAGTVRDTRGVPLPDMCVTAYLVLELEDGRYPYAEHIAVTRSDGRYDLHLWPDTYAVRFAPCQTWAGGVWWDGKASVDEADLIEVAPGMLKDDVDAVLPGFEVENDAAADAIDIWSEPFGHRISTARATVEPGEETPCETGATVWYRFTASSAGTFIAETRRSDYDTTIAVYTGASVDDLTYVDCVNDTASSEQAELTVPTQPGVTYWFQVGGSHGATGELEFRFYAD